MVCIYNKELSAFAITGGTFSVESLLLEIKVYDVKIGT